MLAARRRLTDPNMPGEPIIPLKKKRLGSYNSAYGHVRFSNYSPVPRPTPLRLLQSEKKACISTPLIVLQNLEPETSDEVIRKARLDIVILSTHGSSSNFTLSAVALLDEKNHRIPIQVKYHNEDITNKLCNGKLVKNASECMTGNIETDSVVHVYYPEFIKPKILRIWNPNGNPDEQVKEISMYVNMHFILQHEIHFDYGNDIHFSTEVVDFSKKVDISEIQPKEPICPARKADSIKIKFLSEKDGKETFFFYRIDFYDVDRNLIDINEIKFIRCVGGLPDHGLRYIFMDHVDDISIVAEEGMLPEIFIEFHHPIRFGFMKFYNCRSFRNNNHSVTKLKISFSTVNYLKNVKPINLGNLDENDIGETTLYFIDQNSISFGSLDFCVY